MTISCRQPVLPCTERFADEQAETAHRTSRRPAAGPWLHGCHDPQLDGAVVDRSGCWHTPERNAAA